MTIEYLLARLTAQSPGPRPKEPGKGKPTLTAADISLISSHAPHMSYHALMAKICDDRISEREILKWAKRISLAEWFSNPLYAEVSCSARALNKLPELAVLAWINPQLPHAANIKNQAAFVNENPETYRKKYRNHFAFLLGELAYLEEVGRRAVMGFLHRKEDD